MRISKFFTPLAVLTLFSCGGTSIPKQDTDPLAFVDPFIGTDGIVHTFPGAVYPFGSIQLSPDGDITGWNWCSGYHSSDDNIMGFSHNHLSGTGWSDLGDILVTATSGTPEWVPGDKSDPDGGYRSRISHDPSQEKASAGYYCVELLDYGITAEMTATERVGFHKYTAQKGDTMNIVIDPAHKIFGKSLWTSLEVVDSVTARGFCRSVGWGGPRTIYFTASFSRPFDEALLRKASQLDAVPVRDSLSGENVVGNFRFACEPSDSVEVRVALSGVSLEGAEKNLAAETSKSFTEAYGKTRGAWEEKLGRYRFESADTSRLRLLYTALYHAMIQPNLWQDADGKYSAMGKVFDTKGEFVNYSTFSLWDTHRAVHPLFTMTEPEVTADIVASLVSRYENGGQIPLWELTGWDNTCMIGYPAVSVISDAILKGIPGIDAEKALEAMVSASNHDYTSSSDGPSGVDSYRKLGYVKAGIPASVSKTAENSYYDWCIARVAEKLGKDSIRAEYDKRALSFLNHYNDSLRLLLPRTEDGEFIYPDMSDWESLKPHYVSGNIWAYSYYWPHAIDTMINRMGGKERFVADMDSMLNTPMNMKGEQHVDISGFFGHYGHGDEPGHQFLYLYNPAGAAWKIADAVNMVADSVYNDSRNGMPNNDDCGQMSVWYLFSSMGFYPVCPGDGRYYIGAPMISGAEIDLYNGKRFTMTAEGYSPTNRYVKSAWLNGKRLDRGYITHDEIMNGASLRFVMTDKPCKDIFPNG